MALDLALALALALASKVQALALALALRDEALALRFWPWLHHWSLRLRYKYYKKHSRSGLVWSRLRADRGLLRPSVFRTTIGVCKILSKSVDIWQYEEEEEEEEMYLP